MDPTRNVCDRKRLLFGHIEINKFINLFLFIPPLDRGGDHIRILCTYEVSCI